MFTSSSTLFLLTVFQVALAYKVSQPPANRQLVDSDPLSIASIDEFFDANFFNNVLVDQEAAAALKERIPPCGLCSENLQCESNNCYMGRCVSSQRELRAHSLRRCFQYVPARDSYRGEECARCGNSADCYSGLCRFGRCIYPGVLQHMSMLVCFRDSYVSKC